MRRIAPLLLLLLAGCPRQPPERPATIDCAAAGRPELGNIVAVDCEALIAADFTLLESPGDPLVDRSSSHDPLVAAADTELRGLGLQARDRCTARNACELDEARYRHALEQLGARASTLRRLVQEAAPAAPTRDAARAALAEHLGVAAMAPGLGTERPVACPTNARQPCPDGTCAPTGATCCGDGTHCPTGACCGMGCCGAGEVCGPDGRCEAAPTCGGAWPVACPDGTCAPAGATCCGEGRFCRSGTCCGEGACCTELEACVAGRCVPGAAAVCEDPARPIPCADGACAPIGGSCCGDGRVCESGTCCGPTACCLAGEQCVDGRCMGPAEANPRCRGDWPTTCADGTCAPAGAACCGEGRYCAPGSQCCGTTCCLPGEICEAGACIGP